ncbi:MAG: bifunctional aspartate kinase/diaminopimelate decarboxylase [Longimicrobiales bacterium]|nr:bifunctional aspartate kinase/diaminopimelate decarboxylase [Longimicrobiales bacterium]
MSPDATDAGWVVLKYGGTSVADPAHWPSIAAALRARRDEGARTVLVHSALAGVSDLLERLGRAAAGARGAAGPGEGAAGGPGAAHLEVLSEVRARHHTLLDALGLPVPDGLTALERDLERLVAGVALTGELSPSLRARILSCGELMATRIAVAYLEADGLEVSPVDARSVLRAETELPPGDPRHFLAAGFRPERDEALARTWRELPGVIVTQGFLAADARGRTVLLGRGGSDTSAAWIAAKLGARRLEIWTDVPGMFSADPRLIPSARLLRRLSFEEAQEVAATGARVLHPRCLPVAHRAGIPVHIHSTRHPERAGTVVCDDPGDDDPRIKAVAARAGVVLVSMETPGMWQEAGFLARAFAVFAELGLSIDLVSTSESVVTVTLDATQGEVADEALALLERRLAVLCTTRVVRPCAAVSVVGARMRASLHRLAPALESFQEHEVYLVSQAASDLNFTVVVEEAQAEPLMRNLHALVLGHGADDEVLGPSWEELTLPDAPPAPPPWWRRKREALLEVAREAPARYVYHADTLREAAAGLLSIGALDRVLYAVKANPHPGVLRVLGEAGLGFECVSPGELRRVRELFPDLPRDRILFTPNFAPQGEYEEAFAAGVRVTLDNLHPLERWPEVFRGREIFARMDVGEGRGHHGHVRTAGVQSKFGIHADELDRLETLCTRHGVTLVGLHAHSGSGIREPEHWQRVAGELARIAGRFPAVEVLDLGGGLGVPEKEGDRALLPRRLDALLGEVRQAYPGYRLWMEPGRYLVSEAGVLLAAVTQTKEKRGARFVGVATGMNSLLRPALYGAYHRIVNLTRLDDPPVGMATVVGPICESGDRLGRDRFLPATEEGDVLLVANAGAYGHAMASRYNLREPAEEYLLR